MRLPFDLGIIHCIGIGGIGVSGIVRFLVQLGYEVRGSDVAGNKTIESLRASGIEVYIGHNAKNVEGSALVVYSSAIVSENCELVAARALGIPTVSRAEMLGEMMRLKWAIGVSGSHGKTTTTSIIAHLLDAANLDPSVVIGGIINSYESNSRPGSGQWFVAETDESDGSFSALPITVAVVTNIDEEHMEYYGSFSNLYDAYRLFIDKLPFFGFAALCIDHEVVSGLAAEVTQRKVITYGLDAKGMVSCKDVSFSRSGTHFSVTIRRGQDNLVIKDLFVPLLGEHNLQNVLASIAVMEGMRLDVERFSPSLRTFSGVKRRFTLLGKARGISFVDDYAHHPVEIRATLSSALIIKEREIVAIFQPHRYSRLSSLFEDFARAFYDADKVVVLPVYAAGEDVIADINANTIAQRIRESGHKNVQSIGSDDIERYIMNNCQSGDLVIFLGAGDISNFAYSSFNMLKRRDERGIHYG